MKEASTVPERESFFNSGARLIKLTLKEGAQAWGVSQRTMGMILVIPFIVAGMGAISALFGKEAYKWFTREDGFAESMQVLFYGLSLVMALIVTRRRQRSGERLIPLLYLGLSLAFVFMIGEEISWGQRIFGWETTSSLAEINKQSETNLHNIYGVGSTFKWVQMLVGAYGTILPLAVLRWPPGRRWRELTEAVIPHYTLVLFFLPMFVWRLFRNTLDVPEQLYFVVAEYNEVIELILVLGFVFFMAFQLRRLSVQQSES